ncbi:MAG: hypothetical protein SF029_12035 [bacterium]|nr:hypothetical protein [bacterium]
MKQPNYVNGWLYAANQHFERGELSDPVNKAEIIRHLMLRYRVFDWPLYIRIPLGIICVIVAGIFGLNVIGLAERLIVPGAYILNDLEKFFLLYLLVIGLFGVYILLIYAQGLFLHQIHRVRAAWNLLNTGVVIPGVIVMKNVQSFRFIEYTYEFFNPSGKRIRGKYTIRVQVRFYFRFKREQMRVHAQAIHRPHPKPKEVRILYANDKIHTLL